MTDIMEQSFWYKMRYTPLRDVLRGRITARLDLRRLLEAADLPPAVKQLIYRVAKKTRLWRLEQLDVMKELISHFAEGIKSGVSPEELIRAFGDETEAAILIRRAKRRNRPPAWQVLRVTGWLTAVLAVFYGAFAIYFFAGRPSPRINYIARVNQTIEKTPLEDRAWPIYRRALLSLGHISRASSPAPKFDIQPGMGEWPGLLETVTRHQEELQLIRDGAAKSTLGFLLGAKGSVHDPALWPDQKPTAVDAVTGQELAYVEIPPLQTLRDLAGLLRADAVLARQARDGKRLLRDLNSILGLAHQVGDNAPLLSQLVALTIYDSALDQIELTLRQDPTLIGSEDWIALAHRLSGAKVAADLVTVDMERMAFEDRLQRSFTDDGSGKGRLTPQGVKYFAWVSPHKSGWIETASEPMAGLVVPSRQTLEAEYARFTDRAAINMKVQMREADWRSFRDELDPSHYAGGPDWRSARAIGPIPDYPRMQATVERSLGRRDGLLVAIALEVFRREHGKYPESLSDLVPQLLPEIPADRITGEPVRFRIVNSQPLVYSVGADRKDDGGRPAVAKNSQGNLHLKESQLAAVWDATSDSMPDGDWVLYPTVNKQAAE
jgi:hypothetical protein